MVSRRPNPKDISLIFENFAGINFRESPMLKNFAGINFRESTFSGVKKGIYFREFGQNLRNFLPAKISSLKVHVSPGAYQGIMVRYGSGISISNTIWYKIWGKYVLTILALIGNFTKLQKMQLVCLRFDPILIKDYQLSNFEQCTACQNTGFQGKINHVSPSLKISMNLKHCCLQNIKIDS